MQEVARAILKDVGMWVKHVVIVAWHLPFTPTSFKHFFYTCFSLSKLCIYTCTQSCILYSPTLVCWIPTSFLLCT